MAKVAIDLEGRDNASRALQSASARLLELRGEIDKLRAKGSVNLTVADTRNVSRLTSEANRLERALTGVGMTGAQSASQLTRSFGGLQNVLSGLGLGGMGMALTGAGFAAAAVGAGKLALSLETMREESAQVEARFVGFTGSTAKANEAFRAFDTTLGNAMTRDEKMATATQLLGLGLARTAQDAADMTKQALILGISMDTLTQALETGRVNGLVQYGISVSDVKRRAEELQKAQAGLSDEEAKAIAIKEQLAKKAEAVAAAGGQAATATTELGKAFGTFKDTVADFVNLEGAIRNVTTTITGLTALMSEGGRAQTRFTMATATLADAEAYLAGVQNRTGAAAYANYDATLKAALAARDQAAAELEVARVMRDVTTNAYDSAAAEIAWSDAGINAATVARTVGTAAAATVAPFSDATSAALGFANALNRVSTSGPAIIGQAASAWYGGGSGDFYGAITDAKIAEDARYATELAQQRKTDSTTQVRNAASTAKSAGAAWDSEFSKISGRISGYLQSGMSASIGLGDRRGDLFKPGSNGPFEAIFRAQAIAQGGIEGPQEEEWARMYGLTPETAAKIAGDFQRGIFSPEVQKLVDVDALVSESKMADMAQKTQESFAAAIARKAGVKVNLVENMFGYGATGATGEKSGAAAEAQVTATMGKLATSIGDTVAGKDFAGKIIGYGNTIWGYFETGIVDTAKKSAALQSAIDGMVANAIGRRGGGGNPITNAGRSGGVP